MLPWYRRAHRKRLLAEPYPEHWNAWLTNNVAQYSQLTDAQRTRLRTDLRILVTEKNWEGCDGLRMTEEIKVTIAAQAALMLVGMEHDYFSQVLSIIVFPSQYEMVREETDQEAKVALGQAFWRGPVLLSWNEVLAEGRDPSAGRNLVIHEFAHQLDFLDGSVNGVPALRDAKQTHRWSRAMKAQFLRLQRDLRRGRKTFLGEYAATHPTEFFSVLSEKFFTVPRELKHFHPNLHEILVEYYGIDPSGWLAQ